MDGIAFFFRTELFEIEHTIFELINFENEGTMVVLNVGKSLQTDGA
jgi:hypothetical protein